MTEVHGEAINGWTAPRLDELNATVAGMAEDVANLRSDFTEMKDEFGDWKSEENKRLRARIQQLEERPRAWLFGVGIPILVAVIVALLSHAHI